MAQKLIRGGWILSMDPKIGEFRSGDLLIEGGLIAAVAPRIEAPLAEVVDASGCIVLPGLVNAHQHTWQTGLRGVAGNWTILEYFRHVHAGLATRFGPEDIYIANLVGALNQINCGATTLVDWCHNNPTPDHSDRAIDAISSPASARPSSTARPSRTRNRDKGRSGRCRTRAAKSNA